MKVESGIICSLENDIYRIGENLYKLTVSPTPSSISVGVIEPIVVYPEDGTGIVVNPMGHFEGDLDAIEKYNYEKGSNVLKAGNDLGTLLTKIKRTIYLEPIQMVSSSDLSWLPQKDLLICSDIAISKLTDLSFSKSHNVFAFEMFSDTEYVGKNIIENWPFMLLLESTYHEIVSYLQALGLYQNRWPFNHVWQNGIEFSQMTPILGNENFSVWSMGYFHSFQGLYVRDIVMPNQPPNDYLLIVDWGNVYPASALLISKSKYPKNIYWCANGKEEVSALKSMGVQAHLVSHNIFVNDKVFVPKNCDKKYNAIFNQTLIPFKRPGLTKKLEKVIYTSGSPPTEEYQKMIDAQVGSEVKINSTPHQIAEFMNESICGLALSQGEGGNYATTEYLLCGIPVVTTKNVGGRDTYLDETNSIYCKEDTPEEVRRCVQYIIDNREKFDPMTIRKGALEKNKQMVETLKKDILLPILKKYNVDDQPKLDAFIEQVLSIPNPNSKGRTMFQPEFSIVEMK